MPKNSQHQKAVSAHRKVKVSTARSRKNVTRPRADKVERVLETRSKAEKSQAPAKKNAVTAAAKTEVRLDEVAETEKAPEQIITEVAEETQAPACEQATEKIAQVEQKVEGKTKIADKTDEQVCAEAEGASEPVQIRRGREQYIAHDEAQVAETVERATEKQASETLEQKVAEAQEQKAAMQSEKSQEVVVELKNQEKIIPVARRHTAQRGQRRSLDMFIQSPRPAAKQLKEWAIEDAIREAAQRPVEKKTKKPARVYFGFKRVILALACAAAAVFAIVYFVNLNAPNISLKVAALQTGIDATYPSYVPRDYNLSDITSENGKITLNFSNAQDGGAFAIIEEKSAWDSAALLNNYVREVYGDNYTEVREQGLTLYMSGSDAAWVNGGVVYKLRTTTGALTKKQIKAIAVSL